MNNEEEEVIQIIFNWINLGYRRESCIKMMIAEGYSKKFAIKVVDEAFERLAELYNDLARKTTKLHQKLQNSVNQGRNARSTLPLS